MCSPSQRLCYSKQQADVSAWQTPQIEKTPHLFDENSKKQEALLKTDASNKAGVIQSSTDHHLSCLNWCSWASISLSCDLVPEWSHATNPSLIFLRTWAQQVVNYATWKQTVQDLYLNCFHIKQKLIEVFGTALRAVVHLDPNAFLFVYGSYKCFH